MYIGDIVVPKCNQDGCNKTLVFDVKALCWKQCTDKHACNRLAIQSKFFSETGIQKTKWCNFLVFVFERFKKYVIYLFSLCILGLFHLAYSLYIIG